MTGEVVAFFSDYDVVAISREKEFYFLEVDPEWLNENSSEYRDLAIGNTIEFDNCVLCLPAHGIMELALRLEKM